MPPDVDIETRSWTACLHTMGSSRIKQWLTRIAPIYPREGALVAVCLGVNLLIVSGIMFGRNARDSLFLVYFGIEYLPYMYFANALFLVLCSLAYTVLVDRTERGRLLGGVSLLFVACLVASRLILPRPAHHWFYPFFYIEAQVIWYFSLMQFWTFVGDLFDTRQAKRVFPLLAVGALAGMIGVGLGSKTIVHSLGTENLILVWAGLILMATVLGGYGYRRYRPAKEPAKPEEVVVLVRARPSEWQKIKDGIEDVGREPLQRSLAGYILLLWTVYALVDFCFNKTMRAKYPNPTDLTTFFGRFVGAQGFLCLVVQLFFTRAVISRLGVGTTINFHPATLLLGTAWMGLRYGYPSVLTTKLGDATLLYTFSDSSYQLLYNPVPPDRRARVRGFIEGYIRPLSLAAAGGLILVANSYLKPIHLGGVEISTGQQLSWGALGLAGAWLGFALTAKKGYIRALLRNLQADSPALRHAAANALGRLKDPASLSQLAKALKSENAERVVAAVKFLEDLGSEDAAEVIAPLLTHSEPHVRATAASALGRLTGEKAVERISPLLGDADARVRANVIEALAEIKDPALLEKIRPLLGDSSTRTRVSAILTVTAIQGPAAVAEWIPALEELVHGDRQARTAAAYALGRLPVPQSVDMLAQLLDYSDVRCLAAQALGRVGTPRVIPRLIEALAGPPELRHDTRRAIAAILRRSSEEATLEIIRSTLETSRPEIRSELADVLGRLKDLRVLDALVPLLKDPEWRVRWKVLKSFERLARVGPLPERARAALFDYARGELADFRQSLTWSRALKTEPRDEAARVLEQALEEDRVKIEERVFHMLGILCGRERMLTIFQKLNSGNARLKADALEALDNLAPKGLAQEVLGLLEPPPAPRDAKTAPATALGALAHHTKPWIRACTAYYLGFHPLPGGEGLLATLAEDRDAVVRQTAVYAGGLAMKEKWRPRIQTALESPDALVRHGAERQPNDPGGPASLAEKSEPMLLTVEKVLYLKTAPLFAGLDGEELAALADIALEKDFQPGEVVFEENQVAHHLYVVARGKVEVFHRLDSSELSIATLGEKECFGEMAILDDEPRSASVRAVELTVVLKIDRESFRELISERPQIAFAIFKIISTRLRQKNIEVESLHALDSGRHFA